MKKLRKRTIFVIILILLIFATIFKIYHFIIINKIYNKFERFLNEENRFYSVIEISEKQKKKNFKIREIFKEDRKIKYIKLDTNGNNIIFELKNFKIDETYIWKNGKILDEKESCMSSEKVLFNIPNIINISEKMNLKELLKIYYIKSIKYNDKDCYEIITKSEVIVVSKDTYLPIYMYKNIEGIRSGETMKVKYFYNFEVGTVTDENMQVP